MIQPPVAPHPTLDARLCSRANRWGTRRAIGRFFAVVSRLGDGMFWYASMAALAIFGGARGLQASVHMAATGLSALLLYRALKGWTKRPRPFRACPGVIAHVPPLDEFSFPSGHTLQAVAFTLVALAYFPVLAAVLMPFTVLVALSRVVLGLHYPSDVLAACVIGGALGSLSLYAVQGVSFWL
ncbi:phosphatase PAP2 family protein [Oleiagrimonas sp. MCCC 1A03011]|uniref:phosphatase PAP2 family protein n=1 Tax=Oleiagrimonas sp. MCCC 1A03011 TaxID=1926883 RepID=UPI000DC3D298|nr:phosphatase PAP2 family protein [Oleiagrimonas sp. MCCC 1A03011]RAP58572.1 phosphatase PAP2 family protein [Oleiagrimonas sp. MCCC 1A03011]